MDFARIIKRAWRITWQYKALWVLGIFAGASGGFGGWGTSSYRTSSRDLSNWGTFDAAWSQASAWIHDWAPVLIAAAVALFLIAILWLVLSLAAQGGLAWEVDAVERGQRASLAEGWNVGFHNWGRVVLAGIVLMLPILLVGLFVAGISVAALVPAYRVTSSGLDAASATAGLAGLAAIGVVAVPLLIVLGFVLGNMYLLSVRFIAIEGRTSMEAVRASWGVVRHRFKDVLLMWLITIALSFAFAITAAIPLGIAAVGVALTAVAGAWPVSVVLGLALFAGGIVLSGIWSTFTSAMWTIFFRRLTGREVAAAHAVPPGHPTPAVQPGYYYPPGSYPPPPPPVAPGSYSPVAPPAAPRPGAETPAPPAPPAPAAPPPTPPPSAPGPSSEPEVR